MEVLLGPLIALARAGLACGGAATGRISLAALCGVLAGIAATASIGCGLVALWIVVLPHLGPAGTALVLAGVLAALCPLLLTLARAIIRHDRRRPGVEPALDASLLAASELFREHKGTMLLAALVAGLSVGSGGGNR